MTRNTPEQNNKFILKSEFDPAGDQPYAINNLIDGLNDGLQYQTLLGVTGSGKTFTMANIIAKTNRPALIIAHNKTLGAQLYAEFRDFFPYNKVEYFVSYYDYYQPEAYVPHKDLYIEKDSSINDHIEQMRLSATKSLLEYNDVIVIASVSAIYGIGDAATYKQMTIKFTINELINQQLITRQLITMQYQHGSVEFKRGSFRIRGEVIDIFPAEYFDDAIRISIFDDVIENIYLFDPLTGKIKQSINDFTLFPSSHYVSPKDIIDDATNGIKQELTIRIKEFEAQGKTLEAFRIKERTNFDLEMLEATGFCKGIENYSRHITKRDNDTPPPTLFNYLAKNCILFIDESHVTISQIGAMYKGDRARKENLVNYGFRLPSALDNRPLRFHEFEQLMPQTIFVSATPGVYEHEHQNNLVQQLVRPTGLVDPIIEVRDVNTQIDDLMREIKVRINKNERVLITTLTKKMAEKLSEYYQEHNIKVKYLHSDIETVERVEIIKELRMGLLDVLIGVNLLREGLDIPEVSLVAVLDADKEGFLRSERSLIQTIGRTARHINGMAIFYANKITLSMEKAINETNRRRNIQLAHNAQYNIIPYGIKKDIVDIIDNIGNKKTSKKKQSQINVVKNNELQNLDFDQRSDGVNDIMLMNLSVKEINLLIVKEKNIMKKYITKLAFEEAAICRDKIKQLEYILTLSII